MFPTVGNKTDNYIATNWEYFKVVFHGLSLAYTHLLSSESHMLAVLVQFKGKGRDILR